jgi:hypothetical protein
MAKKYVYSFGGAKADGAGSQKALLGGKAGLFIRYLHDL